MGDTSLHSFIADFEQKLRKIFYESNDINQLSLQRGLPDNIWKDIMDMVPLSVGIPAEYGGRGCIVKECLSLLSAASYESLPLSLTFGINIALFLEPLAKYGNEAVKKQVFDSFLHQQSMGGLMITEPDFGSDALNMTTAYQEYDDSFAIKGMKHWQGLTGQANFWLIAARQDIGKGNLSRDIDFFLADNSRPEQNIVVESYFSNLGLYMIPYGLNRIDISVPKSHQLIKKTTGIKMMLDILHRSRMQFPGMGMGFIRRMLDEALEHCKNRMVGASNLFSMDSIKFQLSRIQTAFTICSAMCYKSSNISSIANNLAAEGLEANSMKALVTDLMHESAQLCLQLSGANGYKISHIAGRGIVDSRPFQIFEGSNEMLYTQIAEAVIKEMKRMQIRNLYTFLSAYQTTKRASPHFKEQLDFNVTETLTQRKLVDLGKIISRLICTGYTLELEDVGYRSDLVQSCIGNMKVDIAHLISNLYIENVATPVDDYREDSNWAAFI
ncbi:acyl-CoA dehydrogenase family protein [Chitinophaga rhizophila]|uniref:Acyl-CoA/acyl-ACP dehydrogenase n=1 Tax=Chitinophaga rhizophila TaxID=2866212 RepID=A0ABS7G6R4_9BACT|nr:acyl-CoA dehydrogenase family protein [Chitinophaga rhizophila]MBW8683332.1 acyl-CoA/acyl-ACP dehydrogenase [Chitinophaga rhizophila]